MKTNKLFIFLLIVLSVCVIDRTAAAQSDKFSALGYLPTGIGRSMVGAGRTFSVDIYIEAYSSDEDANRLHGILTSGGGGDAVLKSLEKMKSIGKIELTGRIGFYDLKFIRSRNVNGG